MGSRMMHLAAAKLLCDRIPVRDAARFRLGSILTDAESGEYGKDTHFKRVTPDGEKYFDLRSFRGEYGREIASDDLYLGYYLHIVADAVYRYLVYEKYKWDPSVPGNVERLHNDYRLTNACLSGKYGLSYDIVVPDGIENERIVRRFPFTIDGFLEEMKSDFLPYKGGEPFFLTPAIADEYISLAVEVCGKEYAAFSRGRSPVFEYSWK